MYWSYQKALRPSAHWVASARSCARQFSRMSRANLPSATGLAKASSDTVHQMPDSLFIRATSNWRTLEDQSLARASIRDLFENTIPTIRHKKFLSKEECRKSVEVIKTHQIVSSPEELADNRLTYPAGLI